MSHLTNDYLGRIVKGTSIVFLGTILGILFGFAGRVILARSLTSGQYGFFSIALVLLNVFVVISAMGLQEGVVRQIAYYQGGKDISKVKALMLSALGIPLIVSISLSLAFFFASDLVSVKIFHATEFSTPLRIVSITIPFFALIQMLSSIFRGLGQVGPMVYFQTFMQNGLFLLFLFVAALFGLLCLNYNVVYYLLFASFLITCLVYIIYTIKKLSFLVSAIEEKTLTSLKSAGRELLFFSFPLLSVIIFNMAMQITDTIALGYLKPSEDVGLYNASLPLANLILLPLASMGFIFVPVFSRLFSQNLIEEMKRGYQVLTKWVFSFSFPIFLILVLFPEVVLNSFFGPQYTPASSALRILSVGFVFHIFFGANTLTLFIMGKVDLLMWANLIAAILNIILNIGLIPFWGINGAAIASLVAYFAMNIFCSAKLYHLSGIHPFSKGYLRSIAASFSVTFSGYCILTHFASVTSWMLPLLFVLFVIIHGLSVFLTKGIGQEDIDMIRAIETKTGIKTGLLARIAKNVSNLT